MFFMPIIFMYIFSGMKDFRINCMVEREQKPNDHYCQYSFLFNFCYDILLPSCLWFSNQVSSILIAFFFFKYCHGRVSVGFTFLWPAMADQCCSFTELAPRLHEPSLRKSTCTAVTTPRRQCQPLKTRYLTSDKAELD
jgi:hypothetical protein